MTRRQPNGTTGAAPLGGVRALVVMGVSGSGKTSVGLRVASELGWEFLDADAFHPPSNRDKMAAGQALSDEDRVPWLHALRSALAERIDSDTGVVLACSALRRGYRDVLRGAGQGVAFLYLKSERDLARARIAGRAGHFFPAALIDSQFGTLEEPLLDVESDVAVVDASEPLESFTRGRVVELFDRLA